MGEVLGVGVIIKKALQCEKISGKGDGMNAVGIKKYFEWWKHKNMLDKRKIVKIILLS